MTTIAFRDGVLAADSMSTYGGVRLCNEMKLHRIRGAIIGLAGGSAGIAFLDWYRDGARPLKFNEYPNFGDDSYCALVLTKKGLFLSDGNLRLDQVFDPFFAIGSGKGEAMAAMHCGKTAVQAVRIACRVDSQTGGRVRYMRLDEKQPA